VGTRKKAAFVQKHLQLLGPLVELLAFKGKIHNQKPNQTGLSMLTNWSSLKAIHIFCWKTENLD